MVLTDTTGAEAQLTLFFDPVFHSVLYIYINKRNLKKNPKQQKSILQAQDHLNINVSWHNRTVIVLKVGPNCSYFTN